MEHIQVAISAAEHFWPERTLDSLVPTVCQGTGSLTYIATFHSQHEPAILQLRQVKRAIPLELVSEARKTLGELLPGYRFLGEYSIEEDGAVQEVQLQRWLVYEITLLEGVALSMFCKPIEPSDPGRMMPTIAEGVGRLLGKCCSGVVPTDGACLRNVLLRSKRALTRKGEDPKYAMFSLEIQELLDSCGAVFRRLPFEWTNGDLSLTNLMVNRSGEVTGLVDWEWCARQPLGFSLGLMDECDWRVSWDPLKGAWVDSENGREVERAFWRGWTETVRLEVTEQLVRDVEVCMRIRAFEWDYVDEEEGRSRIRRAVEYRIPRDVVLPS